MHVIASMFQYCCGYHPCYYVKQGGIFGCKKRANTQVVKLHTLGSWWSGPREHNNDFRCDLVSSTPIVRELKMPGKEFGDVTFVGFGSLSPN